MGISRRVSKGNTELKPLSRLGMRFTLITGVDTVTMVNEGPRLIVVVGAPGSGKSTLAAALATALKATLIDRDTFFAPMAAVALKTSGKDPADLDSPLGKELSKAAYSAAEALAKDNIKAGSTVVLVAPYSNRAKSDWLSPLTAITPNLRVVWSEIEPELLHTRVEARNESRDRMTLATWDRFINIVTLESPYGDHIKVDAAMPLAQMLEQVIKNLN